MSLQKSIQLESVTADLFAKIGAQLSGKCQSFQLLRDDDFNHRRDRDSNDIHLFLELLNSGYFHLRAYIRHMLQNKEKIKSGELFLTGYYKDEISLHGGQHSFRQGWYSADGNQIAIEIEMQNPHLFSR